MEKNPELRAKFRALERILADFPSVAVAFSGGVDSTLLLKVALDVLGRDRVLAITVRSPFFPTWEEEESRRLAESLGVRQLTPLCEAMERPEIVANDPRRCYHCKLAVLALCREKAGALGFSVLAEGSNKDDQSDYRPGSQAVRERGVRSPLLEAGLTKQDVRDISRHLQLPTADKAAFACLATRVPYGQPLTREKLAQIEACESLLFRRGLANFRARHHGDTVRIEIPEGEMPRMLDEPLRKEVIKACQEAGFRYVTLDLEGYRTGRMNEELP